jgi:CSLREA domain-containing protein
MRIWLGVLAAALFYSPSLAFPATFLVNHVADVVDAAPGDGVCETAPGNGICTLRAAIQEANALAGADTVLLPSQTYEIGEGGEIDDEGVTDHIGDLDIADHLSLIGGGLETTHIILEPFRNGRLIDIHPQAQVYLEGLTLQDGFLIGGRGGANLAIREATVVLRHIRIAEGFADGNFGAGLLNERGQVTILESFIHNNNCDLCAGGGGIANLGGIVTVIQSTIDRNQGDSSSGAGIYNEHGSITLRNVSLVQNGAGDNGTGGGFYNKQGTFVAINSTIARNVSIRDAGVGTNEGGVTLFLNSTIVENRCGSLDNFPCGQAFGGGLVNSAGFVGLANTILSGNTLITFSEDMTTSEEHPSNCRGTLFSLGHNILGDLTGCDFHQLPSDRLEDPKLAAYEDSGEPGFAHYPLQPDSPAINHGAHLICPERDQLQQRRVRTCDMGSIEFQP